MDLKIIQDDEHELWDSAVRKCAGRTIFHTWKWLKKAERYSKKNLFGSTIPAKLHPLLVSENGAIIGLFPVFLYKHPLFRIVTSPPSGIENLYLGPLLCESGSIPQGKKYQRWMNFFEITDTYIKKMFRPTVTLIHTPPEGMDDMRPFKWAGYEVEPQYTYEVDLTIGKKDIWNGFSKSLKHGVTKAKRIGVSIEEGSMEDLEFIYDRLRGRNHIYCEKQFFTDIFNDFYPEHLKVFIAKKEGLPISGITTLIYDEKVMFWIGAPKCTVDGISPNELVIWECMSWAIDNGYKVFELIGADDITLFQFKGKFNGNAKIYFTIREFSPIVKICECIYRIISPRYS